MSEAPRSNRPAPSTAATLETELRRRIQEDLAAATEESDGELAEDALAAIIARAVAWAMQWHLDAPEHQRGPRLTSSEGWRSAPGPRGRGPDRDAMENQRFDTEAPRERDRDRDRDRDRFGGGPNRGPRPSGGFGGGGYNGGSGFGGGERRFNGGPRPNQDEQGEDFRAGPRGGGFRARPSGPNRGPRPSGGGGFGGGGGGGGGSSRGGGFAGRKPPRRRP